MESLIGWLRIKWTTLSLRFWAMGQYWWVDRRLEALTAQALQASIPTEWPELTRAQGQAINQRVRILEIVARYHPCRPRCLHRSMVLYRWLQQQGIPARLEVGWGGKIAHAWVSYGPYILNDQPTVRDTTPPLTEMAFKPPD